MTWIKVATVSDIVDDTATSVQVGADDVCLARSDGQLYAIRDECSHGQVALSDGDVEHGTVECVMHGSRFDLRTGQALTPPAVASVAVYQVRVVGEDVYVADASETL
jgi:3-phenylpropionate/trans-cinnamate dioxygenase ferredoxin subunit